MKLYLISGLMRLIRSLAKKKYANKPGEIKKRKWIWGFSFLQNFFTKKDWMNFTTHLVMKSTEYLYLSLNSFPIVPDFNSELTPRVINVNLPLLKICAK